MSGLTPRQVLAEIIRDYRYNVRMGMPVEQSLETLKAMTVDLIEFEKDITFKLGQESGIYAVLHDLQLFGAEFVLDKYTDKSEVDT
jgi:hypothetical protein